MQGQSAPLQSGLPNRNTQSPLPAENQPAERPSAKKNTAITSEVSIDDRIYTSQRLKLKLPTPLKISIPFVLLAVLILVFGFSSGGFLRKIPFFGMRLFSSKEDVVEQESKGSGNGMVEEEGDSYFKVISEEPEGMENGEKQKIPEDFPADVPIFKPSEVMSSFTSPELFYVSFGTEREVDEIANFYKDEMRENGWLKVGTFGDSKAKELSYKKGEHEVLIVMVGDKEGEYKTIILISYAKSK